MSKPETCRFAKSHEWIHFKGHVGSVGVSEHAQKEISDVVFVELPSRGARWPRRSLRGGGIGQGGVRHLRSRGRGDCGGQQGLGQGITALINREPHDGGWLFQIKASTTRACGPRRGAGWTSRSTSNFWPAAPPH